MNIRFSFQTNKGTKIQRADKNCDERSVHFKTKVNPEGTKKYPPYNIRKLKQDFKFEKIVKETQLTRFFQIVMAVDQHCQECLFY